MSTDNPVAVVQRMLEAFQDRDRDRLVETVHPDSRWTYVGANPRPAKGVYVGRDGVRNFFENIIRNLTITIFNAREFVTEANSVVIFGFESGTVNATGNPFRNEWAQKYVIQNGLITEMEEYNVQVDTTP
ncbi:MAG: nuclear transport factor 2 family protein [Propionibacteriaceae bacterium]